LKSLSFSFFFFFQNFSSRRGFSFKFNRNFYLISKLDGFSLIFCPFNFAISNFFFQEHIKFIQWFLFADGFLNCLNLRFFNFGIFVWTCELCFGNLHSLVYWWWIGYWYY
jgi:hypothetical protein